MVNGGGDNNRAEADQWLDTSEKLLASGDFHGAKTYAIRACEADPSRTYAADYIFAISDTLLAGVTNIGDPKVPECYAVLRLSRVTQNPEHVATQYRRLSLLLNPNVNRLPFADQVLKLVSDAWSVLSDPSRKSMYNRELQMSQIGQPYSQPEQFQDSPLQSQAETLENLMATSFWTACPYCFAIFEYPKGYEECTLRCQQCKKAFEAVKTQTPPLESHAKTSTWSPISPLFVCTRQSSSDQQANNKAPPRNNDDLYVTISDDDDDWRTDAQEGKCCT